MFSNSIIVLSSYLAAIGLDAASDAVRDNGNKKLSHVLEALMLAVFLSTPFTFNADVHQIGWYLVPFVLMRVSLFDPIYNKIRKLPLCYHGTTSLWDKLVSRFNPPCGWKIFGRVLALGGAVAMILQMIK